MAHLLDKSVPTPRVEGDASAADLAAAALDQSHVSGLTHNFYRYPARFSPALARAAIRAFTSPGDIVLDPFMGGGTTLVEAVAEGRNAVGIDISSLANFVTTVKTTAYGPRELRSLAGWVSATPPKLNMTSGRTLVADRPEYRKHLSDPKTWRIRRCIEQALWHAAQLPTTRLESFARCVVLRTAQWALDGRKEFPSVEQFRAALLAFGSEMVSAATEFSNRLASTHGGRPTVRCFQRSATGIEGSARIRAIGTPKLVVTSPPYPGVHVLYHRWQVHGGREAPAPFWIANRLDGAGSSYYTMGDRNSPHLTAYFDQIRAALTSVAAVCDRNTTIVQVVAFSSPEWQLPRYLSVADDAGLEEFSVEHDVRTSDGRLWRSVPNRKWHANKRGRTSGSQEVVLFHRLKRR